MDHGCFLEFFKATFQPLEIACSSFNERLYPMAIPDYHQLPRCLNIKVASDQQNIIHDGSIWSNIWLQWNRFRNLSMSAPVFRIRGVKHSHSLKISRTFSWLALQGLRRSLLLHHGLYSNHIFQCCVWILYGLHYYLALKVDLYMHCHILIRQKEKDNSHIFDTNPSMLDNIAADCLVVMASVQSR